MPIDILDYNLKVQIVFGIIVIAFLLLYIAANQQKKQQRQVK